MLESISGVLLSAVALIILNSIIPKWTVPPFVGGDGGHGEIQGRNEKKVDGRENKVSSEQIQHFFYKALYDKM